MAKLQSYIKDSINELRHKVTWPSYNELQNSSILVLVASLIFALVIGLIDVGFEKIMTFIYNAS
ncbi:preprotein translocase subunit SecE [Roseivirga sp. BDSF3-8]|uniref:preprotein translocase subunit SecE n=1 Tax=Roseivirga sp. BDSF3-8 TaxID=3241598 RepID=UPI0035323ED7